MIKLTSVISPGSIKSLVAIGALALAFAAPAGAECAAAQDIGDSFAVAADADLGYLPFELGSPVAEEAASTEMAQAHRSRPISRKMKSCWRARTTLTDTRAGGPLP